MTIQIKICGVSGPEAIRASITAGADWCGLNFYPPSPRFVTFEKAAELANVAGPSIRKVGVFVDADNDLLAGAVTSGDLDAIQLHGEETPDRVAEVKARFGLPLWKVLSVASAKDISRAQHYAQSADFILFDAKTPKGVMPGGMGLQFDWTLIKAYNRALPWGLAGGLTPENVAEAIRMTGASVVDVSSGVESAPGVKDVDKIAAFCKAVQNT